MPSAGLDHVGDEDPDAVHDAHLVDAEAVVDVFVRGLVQPLPRGGAGDREHERDRPEGLVGLRLGPPQRRAIGLVADDGNRRPSRRGDLLDDLLRVVGEEVRDGNPRALGRQRLRDRAADRAPAPGDERGAAVDLGHARSPS